ncbi:MAG: MFS transporter [Myxococcales bacterium]|nr:MFS transporter [Myxococcales bacterium]
MQLGVFVGIAGGGVLLHLSQTRAERLQAFSLLFAVACLARVSSTTLMALQPEHAPPSVHRLTLRTWLRTARDSTGGRLLLMMLAMQLSVYAAAPFFTPYMLETLKLSYGSYTALTAAAFGARIVTMRVIGWRARSMSAWSLLRVGAFGVVPMAGLWAVADNFAYLLALQLVSGVVWGCYELAALLLFFETIPAAHRVSALTWFNAANAAAIVVGAALGGSLLSWLGVTHRSYALLFVASSSARLLTLLLKPRRGLPPATVRTVPTRVIAVRPGTGGLVRPVVPALEEVRRRHV